MKYIVARSSPFSGRVNVGVVEADSKSDAIYQAARLDGWEDVPECGNQLAEFLRSIEDQYVAISSADLQAYPGIASNH